MKGRSLRRAIDTKCRDCIFDPLARGNWRQQITLCSCTNCPLWEYRPVSRKPLPKSLLNFLSIPDDDPIVLGHRRGLPARAFIKPGTKRLQNGNVSIQGAVEASQLVKVGESERGSPLRNLWATMRGRSAV